MATISIKIVAKDLLPGISDGDFEIREETTVSELLRAYGDACGAALPEKNLALLYFLLNGKPVEASREISASGTLHVCRVIVGG